MNPSDRDAGQDPEHRLHPWTVLHRVIVAAPAVIFLLLPVIRGGGGGAWFNLWIAILYTVLIFPWTLVRYYRFRYRISQDEIMIRSGVTTVNRRNIPVDRIQNIEIEQGILQRMTRTARVSIFTAGSPAAEGVLDVVSLEEAHRVKDLIRVLQELAESGEARDAVAGVPTEGPDVTAPAGRDPRPLPQAPGGDGGPVQREGEGRTGAGAPALIYQMDLQRVLLSGVFRFSLLYIAVFFSIVQYVEPDPEAMLDWFAGGRFAGLAEAAAQSPWVAIGGSALIAVLFAWLSGVAVNLNRYYGFQLHAEGEKLHHRQGLLSRHTGTIPLRKVQAFIIRTNPLMRRFGWFRLEVQTMGFDVKERGHKVAIPFGRWDDVVAAANRLQQGLPHPDPLGIRVPELLPVSRLTIRRAFVRYSVAILLLAGGVGYFWSPGVWLVSLLPLALVGAVLRYRHMGYAEDDRWLYVKKGVVRQHTWLLPLERSQVFYRSASLFQRRLGLASVYIDAAGASATRPAEAIDLPREVAQGMVERAYARFQAIAGNAQPSR